MDSGGCVSPPEDWGVRVDAGGSGMSAPPVAGGPFDGGSALGRNGECGPDTCKARLDDGGSSGDEGGRVAG